MRRTALLLAATLLLPACAGKDPEPAASPSASSEAPVPLPSGKPTASIPSPKPTTLVRTDVIEGTGRVAVPGNALTVNYVGLFYDGKEFDSSFDPGDNPLTFILGGDEVIPGWDQGLIGMRVGGRRQLVIPPELAYGAEGRDPIGPNETLVFVVDLLNVDPGLGGANTFAPQ